ncbi:hypothetical protein Vretifemale_10497, partial [Volvox reticuliferus]
IPYAKEEYGERAIARKYVDGLNAYVRERIEAKYCDVSTHEWYGLLSKIAADAERIWMNQQHDMEKKVAPKSARETTTSQVKQSQAEPRVPSAGTGYYCNHHGANSSHDSRDCRVLHGRKSAASMSRGSQNSTVEALIAEFEAQAKRLRAAMASEERPALQQHPQRAPVAGAGHKERDTPSCEYCGRFGHTEEQCFIKHPDKATANFKAPTKALQSTFDRNLEEIRLQQQPRQQRAAAAAAAAQQEDEEEDVY